MSAVDYWTQRHGDEWLQGYWTSTDAPHRRFFIDRIVERHPASVLEIGCHCGVNLRMLRQELPEASLAGIDPSAEAIAYGQAQDELAGVTLAVGSLDDTASMPDGSWDTVAACYALSYIAPDRVREALAECARLARHAVIVFEPMAIPPEAPGYRMNGDYLEYRHDYIRPLQQIPALAGTTATLYAPLSFPPHALNGCLVIERN